MDRYESASPRPRSRTPETRSVARRSPVKTSSKDEGSLYVTNLPYSFTQTNVHALFTPFGNPALTLPFDHVSSQNKGYAFITFPTLHQATQARHTLDGQEFLGRYIRVEIDSKPKDRLTLSTVKNVDGERGRSRTREYSPARRRISSVDLRNEGMWVLSRVMEGVKVDGEMSPYSARRMKSRGRPSPERQVKRRRLSSPRLEALQDSKRASPPRDLSPYSARVRVQLSRERPQSPQPRARELSPYSARARVQSPQPIRVRQLSPAQKKVAVSALEPPLSPYSMRRKMSQASPVRRASPVRTASPYPARQRQASPVPMRRVVSPAGGRGLSPYSARRRMSQQPSDRRAKSPGRVGSPFPGRQKQASPAPMRRDVADVKPRRDLSPYSARREMSSVGMRGRSPPRRMTSPGPRSPPRRIASPRPRSPPRRIVLSRSRSPPRRGASPRLRSPSYKQLSPRPRSPPRRQASPRQSSRPRSPQGFADNLSRRSENVSDRLGSRQDGERDDRNDTRRTGNVTGRLGYTRYGGRDDGRRDLRRDGNDGYDRRN